MVDVNFSSLLGKDLEETMSVGKCGFELSGPQRMRLQNENLVVNKGCTHANTDYLIQNECFVFRVEGVGWGLLRNQNSFPHYSLPLAG